MSEHLKEASVNLEGATRLQAHGWTRQALTSLLSAMKHQQSYLESQAAQTAESPAQPATTASPTTDFRLGAVPPEVLWPKRENSGESAMASTEAPTPLLQRLLGVLTEAERTHVGQCYGCKDRLERFMSWFKMHVPDADGPTSTSASPASSSSADPSASVDAASPSSESSEFDVTKEETQFSYPTPAPESGERWHVRKCLVADWDLWQVWQADRLVADLIPLESEAEEIVALHNASIARTTRPSDER